MIVYFISIYIRPWSEKRSRIVVIVIAKRLPSSAPLPCYPFTLTHRTSSPAAQTSPHLSLKLTSRSVKTPPLARDTRTDLIELFPLATHARVIKQAADDTIDKVHQSLWMYFRQNWLPTQTLSLLPNRSYTLSHPTPHQSNTTTTQENETPTPCPLSPEEC